MQTHTGNILQVERGIIIQQVNAQGVMASGIAKAIRENTHKSMSSIPSMLGPHILAKTAVCQSLVIRS